MFPIIIIILKFKKIQMIPAEYFAVHQILGMYHLSKAQIDAVLTAEAPKRVVTRCYHGSRDCLNPFVVSFFLIPCFW